MSSINTINFYNLYHRKTNSLNLNTKQYKNIYEYKFSLNSSSFSKKNKKNITPSPLNSKCKGKIEQASKENLYKHTKSNSHSPIVSINFNEKNKRNLSINTVTPIINKKKSYTINSKLNTTNGYINKNNKKIENSLTTSNKKSRSITPTITSNSQNKEKLIKEKNNYKNKAKSANKVMNNLKNSTINDKMKIGQKEKGSIKLKFCGIEKPKNKFYNQYKANCFRPKNIFSKFKNEKKEKNIINEFKSSFVDTSKIEENKQKSEKKNTANNISNTKICNEQKNKVNITNNNINCNLFNNISGSTSQMEKNSSASTIYTNNFYKKEMNNPIKEIEQIDPIELINIKSYEYKDLNKVNKGPIKKYIKSIHDISKTGLAGDEKKVNQDNYFIFNNFNNNIDYKYIGVCDGHGYFGHEVSQYIIENLPSDLNHHLQNTNSSPEFSPISTLSENIKSVFIKENESLLKTTKIDSSLSGSTCVSIIYTPTRLITANIGDSRIVLGKKINNEWQSEDLTRDHNPSIKEEAERILEKGGKIRPMIDDDGSFIGPLRVYTKEDEVPGLAMTRSFGDYLASTAGTISEPEILVHNFEEGDKFFVAASDGLFEFINSKEVVDICKGFYEGNQIVECVEYLYKESYRRWIKEEEDTVDDITIVVVFFN